MVAITSIMTYKYGTVWYLVMVAVYNSYSKSPIYPACKWNELYFKVILITSNTHQTTSSNYFTYQSLMYTIAVTPALVVRPKIYVFTIKGQFSSILVWNMHFYTHYWPIVVYNALQLLHMYINYSRTLLWWNLHSWYVRKYTFLP